jgi:tripartite-type tricarboxylate transporter receptor subunit TctC
MTYVGLAPPGTPQGAVAALRSGFEAAANDPDFIKDSVAKNGIPYSYVSVEQGTAIIRDLGRVSPALLTTLRETIGGQH